MRNLFSFIFFDISIIFFYLFFKLKRRSTGGVHSVLGQVSNGAPWGGAPLLVKLVMAHHTHGAPLLVLKKNIKNFEFFLKKT